MGIFWESRQAIQSLIRDEGAGSMLSLASGDTAGGLVLGGYSAVTQTAMVVAYHVMVNDSIDRDKLVDEFLVLDGKAPGTKTYRRPGSAFRAWLDGGHRGEPVVSPAKSSEPASRAAAIGVWFRRRPSDLVTASVEMARLTHIDASTVAMTVASAAAVAGSSLAMYGADLLYGVAETVEQALDLMIVDHVRFSGLAEARRVPDWLRGFGSLVNDPPAEVVRSLSDDNGPSGLHPAALGVVLASSLQAKPVRLIEVAAMSGGSTLGAITGAIVGSRVGLGRWPWRVPNETWFAEIGRRLSAANPEVRDLPIPYAVEERFNLSPEMAHRMELE